MVMYEDEQPALKEWTREQLHGAATVINLQTGTNQFASQQGMTAMGAIRQNIYLTKDQGRIEPDKLGFAFLKPIYGTNQFASQAGETPIGAYRANVPRIVYKEEWEDFEDKAGEMIVPMQAGSNKFASQSGYAGGIGGRRNQISLVRGRMPNDRRSHGIIPYQAGSNLYASQQGMTGTPGSGAIRQVTTDIESLDMTDEDLRKGTEFPTWQSGTNKYDSQAGTGGFFKPRDVLTITKGGKEIPFEKLKISDGIIPLQNGTNRLSSQRGMTGFGMTRDVNMQPKWKQEWIDQWESAEKEWEDSGRGKLVDKEKWEKEAAVISRTRKRSENLSDDEDDRSTMDQDVSYSVSLSRDA